MPLAVHTHKDCNARRDIWIKRSAMCAGRVTRRGCADAAAEIGNGSAGGAELAFAEGWLAGVLYAARRQPPSPFTPCRAAGRHVTTIYRCEELT